MTESEPVVITLTIHPNHTDIEVKQERAKKIPNVVLASMLRTLAEQMERRGMIWPVETVKAVRRMGTKHFISDMALTYGRDVQDAARYKAWRAIREMGYTFAVDVQQEDIRTEALPRTDDDLERGVTFFKSYWLPESNQVVFFDGPGRGQQMGVPKDILFGPIHGTELDTDLNQFTGEDLQMVVPVRRLTYVFGGWNETRRTWVYRLDPRDAQ